MFIELFLRENSKGAEGKGAAERPVLDLEAYF